MPVLARLLSEIVDRAPEFPWKPGNLRMVGSHTVHFCFGHGGRRTVEIDDREIIVGRRMDPRLDVNIEATAEGLEISGTANLPDGTLLHCEVWRGAPEGPFDDVTHHDLSVSAGRFGIRVGEPGPWSGRATASVELRADMSQPPSVRAVIGDGGERLRYADLVGPGFSVVLELATIDTGRQLRY